MFARTAECHLKELGRQFPAITVVGPRQSGKTTLARKVFPDYAYVSIEDPDIRRFAVSDPRGFLESNPAPLIIDEVQRVPDLLSYLQGRIDREGKNGQYVLTGSHQPLLKAGISQSLAGLVGRQTKDDVTGLKNREPAVQRHGRHADLP